MKIYGFLYCGCVFESSYVTISIHKTKQGAYKAMRKNIIENYQEWYDDRIIHGKNKKRFSTKFGEDERWRINEMELLD